MKSIKSILAVLTLSIIMSSCTPTTAAGPNSVPLVDLQTGFCYMTAAQIRNIDMGLSSSVYSDEGNPGVFHQTNVAGDGIPDILQAGTLGGAYITDVLVKADFKPYPDGNDNGYTDPAGQLQMKVVISRASAAAAHDKATLGDYSMFTKSPYTTVDGQILYQLSWEARSKPVAYSGVSADGTTFGGMRYYVVASF